MLVRDVTGMRRSREGYLSEWPPSPSGYHGRRQPFSSRNGVDHLLAAAEALNEQPTGRDLPTRNGVHRSSGRCAQPLNRSDQRFADTLSQRMSLRSTGGSAGYAVGG